MRLSAAAAAAGVSLIALAAVLLPAGRGALAQATTTIDVGDLYFCAPSFENGVCETTVSEGDTVEWQFVGEALHSTTECPDAHDTCSSPHLWDSPLLDSGTFSFSFDTPGTYLYRCQAHPSEMRGQITVLAAAEPSPSPQASPQATAPATTPTATPAVRASDVQSGGAPPSDGSGLPWLLAVVGGGVLIVCAAALAARALRRRNA